MALSLSDEINHITLAHKNSEIKFKCTKCGKIYRTKHGALCHIPKCPGPKIIGSTTVLTCITCGKRFKSRIGLSQHQRHEHPLIRNEARKEKENRPQPKGFGHTWMREEIELMHKLEVRLLGERNVVKKMCEYLPNKTNKQIRDKRKEKTYREEISNRFGINLCDRTSITMGGDGRNLTLQEGLGTIGNQDDPSFSGISSVPNVLSVSSVPGAPSGHGVSSVPGASSVSSGSSGSSVPGGSSVSSVPGDSSVSSIPRVASTSTVLDVINETRPNLPAPIILITDYSRTPSCEEVDWRNCFLQTELDARLPNKEIPNEANFIIDMLKQAIFYAKGEDGQVPQTHIDYIYTQVYGYIKGKNLDKTEQSNKRNRRKVRSARRKFKKYQYARTQDLYKKNPGLVARHIRNNIEWMDSTDIKPSEEEISNMFGELWGKTNPIRQPFKGEPDDNTENWDLMDVIPDITTKEIAAGINRMKQDTAAGPDGILKKHVTPPMTQEILRLFYCLITACGLQPSMWKEHRTKLLLKQGKDPARAENYRPVTIGSILSRVYWGILDRKIRARIHFTPRQKGFVYEAGCFNDVHILCEIIKLAKARTGLVAVQLDIAKAFDMIPHEAIEDALTRKGIPKYLTQMIRGSYNEIKTTISGGAVRVPMKIKRGVKQGDPLSPFIFNAILEPLILELENMGGFPVNHECSVSTLAFADDIFLLAPDTGKAKELLSRTESYLEDLNMKISAEKCTAFRFRTLKDSWYLEDPMLETVGGKKIPYADADTNIRYIGGKISPWKGLTVEGIEEDFRTTLKRVETAALKPHQKTNLISDYIVPQFIYALVLALVPVTTIRRLDQELRR
jgi:uncharacterized C2H2 Zn-finger protein